MQKGIIGKKLGMTQLFDENGKVVPVTIIEAGPCVVVQKKTVESDGYQAVQLGYGDVSVKKVAKPAKGHFDKANVAPKKTLREFRLDDISGLSVGDIVKADTFAVGDHIDVVGISRARATPAPSSGSNGHRLRESHGTGPVARHGRFEWFDQHPLPCLQGQEAARTSGCGAGHHPEPHRRQDRRGK